MNKIEISVCVKWGVYMALVLNCFFFTGVYGSEISASERRLSLNGLWHFKTLKDPLAEKDVVHPDSVDIKGWDVLSVPGNWDIENEYASYRGLAVYRRMVELPAEWKGGIIGIRFEAVNETARIYINGHYVGSHRGGYTPFEFNVSDLVTYGAKNTVAVVVDNSYGRGAWWPWGGISRDVSLTCNQAVRITQVNITAEPDLQTKRGQVRVQYQVENNNFQTKDLRVSAKIYPFGKKDSSIVEAQSKSLQILGMADTIQDIKLETAKAVDLWHFDHPQLYICEVDVYKRDTLLYKKRVRFGFRKIETKEGKIYLNGEAIRLMGFNRIHDHRAYGNTEPFSLIKRDLDNMKRMGCNMTRMMHAPLAPELLDYADEIGMLIIQEVPVWGREDPQAYKDNPVVRQWLKEMINRDYNHPSVIAWSVANELVLDVNDWKKMRMSSEQYAYVASMIRYIRSQLDATRLLTYVSLTAFRPAVTPENDPAGIGDFICFNNYGDFVDAAKEIHKKWPDKALFVSEFGQSQIGYDSDATLSKNVLAQLAQLGELPYIAGASLWSYNDYRSNFPGTRLGGDRTWGVVDVWRHPKKAADQIAQAFSPVKTIQTEWESAKRKLRVSIVPRMKDDLPAYVLKKYRLKWELLAKDGGVLYADSLLLKDIYPDGIQQSEQFSYAPRLNPYALRVQLKSPTAHVVHEQYSYNQKPDKPKIRHTASSKDATRVMFFPVAWASSYVIIAPGLDTMETIKNWVDIPLKALAGKVEISVQAKNSYGLSMPVSVNVANRGASLPPIIRALVPVEKGLVIGYTATDANQHYVLQLRSKSDHHKIREIKTSLEGAVKIDNVPPGDYELRIKSLTGTIESQWSPWEQVIIAGAIFIKGI